MAKDCYMPPYYRCAYRFWLPVFSLLAAMPSMVLADCNPWTAKLVAVEGTVELRDSDDAPWTQGVAESVLCAGARVRVGEYGRAAVVLQDNTLLRLDARSTLTMPPGETPGSLLDLLQGTVHFISRVTRGLTVRTPFVNAGVEGTEFLVQVDAGSAAVIVFEGKVRAVNAAGEVLLQSGERARASANQAPVRDIPVKPRDAVQWALYYPPILSFTPEPIATHDEQSWQARMTQSMQLYREGQLALAHAALVAIAVDISDARFYTYRASLNLAMGQVPQAQRDIDHALTLIPANADALALKAIIAIVQNERELGLALAQQALAANPTATGATLALSYALQAGFQLEEARSTLERAVAITPNDALLWSRLAELHLMFRELTATRMAAERAAALAPHLSHTQTILGFAQLIAMDVSAARTTFTRAITLDQSAPLPHLGLGLSMIRAGELESGRRELELAAILNPSEALIRSYLGKAYYEERREEVAADQYEMAKQLDPLDPTPWFYAAILKQTQNQPLAALEDLQRAMALNNNRAVYRSRLLLDEDAAARSVGLARIYKSLGFEQQSQVEATKSLAYDPANHSAHRFLSDSYASKPRHEIARSSELLQSQLLQPLSLTPLQPSIAATNLNILSAHGPAEASLNEYHPMFTRAGTHVTATALVGNNDTIGDELIIAGLYDRVAYSLGQYSFNTDGFREQANINHDIGNAFLQVQVTNSLDAQFEFRKRRTQQGDLRQDFNPNFVPRDQRGLDEDIHRLGLHYKSSPQSDFVLSYIENERDVSFFRSPPPSTLNTISNYESGDTQVQYLWHRPFLNLLIGAGASEITGNTQTTASSGAISINSNASPVTDQHYYYLYSSYAFHALVTTLGVSYDAYESVAPDREFDEVNPKFGLIWDITNTARLRLAAYQAFKRELTANQTLEPTQLAGFNQFFDDFNGTKIYATGIAIDFKPNGHFAYGLEYFRRNLLVPETKTGGGVTMNTNNQDQYKVVFSRNLSQALSLNGEYSYEKFTNQTTRPTELKTASAPLELRYFHPTGVFASLQATYVKQQAIFPSATSFEQREEDFTLVNCEVGYRLPHRRGVVSLEVQNLNEQEFIYQDYYLYSGDSFNYNPRYLPNRSIVGRFTLSF